MPGVSRRVEWLLTEKVEWQRAAGAAMAGAPEQPI